MIDSDKNPREFWIERFGGMTDTYTAYSVKPKQTIVYVDETIHVIEMKAYLAVKQELDRAYEEIDKFEIAEIAEIAGKE